jgi:uncharacterized protein YjaG (DUF416 family)
MTPEERFTKIENALETLLEHAAKHNTALEQLIVVSRTSLTAIDKLAEAQLETDKSLNRLEGMLERFLRGDRPNGR